MPEPFKTVQDAIIARLAAQGITCYDHHPIELYGVPSAYLSVSDATAGYMRADQGEVLLGSIEYKLRYYASLEQSVQVAHAIIYSGMRSVMAAFNHSTLGGEVADASVERMAVDPVQSGPNNKPMLLLEVDVRVKPKQYV
jgi:hypothetical protein